MAKSLTICSSLSTLRQLQTIPLKLPLSFLTPFTILFAAYNAIYSPEVTINTSSAYFSRKGTEKPPQTTSPKTSYTTTSKSSSKIPNCSRRFIATITPRPAQPTPGSGPPLSTHCMFLKPVNTKSSFSGFRLSFNVLTTVGILLPYNVRVVSAFGSQPITRQFKSSFAHTADKLATVVLFPIPPFP